MSGQQRQALDAKPLPSTPREMLETIENGGSGCAREPVPGPAVFSLLTERLPSSQTASDQKEASGLFKKLASKLKPPASGQLNTTSTTAKRASTVRAKNAPPLTNDFTSKEQREAALRKCGLLVGKDLSQLEGDLDRKNAKITPIPRDQTTKGGQPSAAEKIIQEWKAKNQAGRL